MTGSPFDEEGIITLVMGIDPRDPGMHGPLKEPCPTEDAIGLVTKIRDMCDNFLRSAGKVAEKKSDTTSQQVGNNDESDSIEDDE